MIKPDNLLYKFLKKSLVSEKLCTYKLVNVFISVACLEVIGKLWNLAFSRFLIYIFFTKIVFCKKKALFCGFGSCIEIIDLADDRLMERHIQAPQRFLISIRSLPSEAEVA
jgi:hypothetical protein